MKKSKKFGLGDVRSVFFVEHCALRHYCSKGFALLPFKNGVKIAAIEGVAPSIDHHPVPKGRGVPAVVSEPVEASQSRQGTPEVPETDFG